MSITLPVVDLSSAVVGTSGTMALQAAGLVAVPSKQPPFLAIFNDSGAGLLITLKKSSQQFYLSAKGHILVAISNSESEIAYSVQNISTNIQVNQLWAVYFYPGEQVTDFTALGTSSVSQQATTLVNVGNPVGTTIIFSEPLGDSNPSGAINITNSGLIEAGDTTNSGKILVSGTHVALAATNNIFPDEITIIGTSNQEVDLLVSGSDAFITLKNQAGTSTVKLQTPSPNLDLSGSNAAKSILTANNAPIQSKDFGGTARDVLWVDGSNQTNLQGIAGTDLIFFKESNGTVIASAGVAGINLSVGGFNPLITPVTVNGSVSGTAQAYEWMQGVTKVTLIVLNAWRSASAVNISLPTPYTKGAYVRCGGVGPSTGGDGGFKLLAASVAQNINIVTALASTGGTVTGATQMFGNSFGECINAFDQVAVWSNINPHTGFIILEGI